MLGDAGGDPVLNVAGLNLALGGVLKLDVGAGVFLVLAGQNVELATTPFLYTITAQRNTVSYSYYRCVELTE